MINLQDDLFKANFDDDSLNNILDETVVFNEEDEEDESPLKFRISSEAY